jgi:hypothetical protein
MSRYYPPDTSDKLPEESWLEYWDRKADERHPEGCQCPHHLLRSMGIGDDPAEVDRAIGNFIKYAGKFKEWDDA